MESIPHSADTRPPNLTGSKDLCLKAVCFSGATLRLVRASRRATRYQAAPLAWQRMCAQNQRSTPPQIDDLLSINNYSYHFKRSVFWQANRSSRSSPPSGISKWSLLNTRKWRTKESAEPSTKSMRILAFRARLECTVSLDSLASACRSKYSSGPPFPPDRLCICSRSQVALQVILPRLTFSACIVIE